MAEQVSTLQAVGKVGNIVGYVGEGKILARNYVPNSNNPRTDAQILQRLIISSASKACAALRGIVDHSFESIPYGIESVNYFMKMNAKMMKKGDVWHYDNPLTGEKGKLTPLIPLDSIGLPCLPYIISKGTLPSPKYGDAYRYSENIEAGNVFSGNMYDMTVKDYLDCFGVTVKDQLTLVQLNVSMSDGILMRYKEFVENHEGFLSNQVSVCRINFKEGCENNKAFSYNRLAVNGDRWKLNYDNLDLSRCSGFDSSLWPRMAIMGNQFVTENNVQTVVPYLYYNHPGNGDLCGFALIRSRFENGKWRRSTEVMRYDAGDRSSLTTNSMRKVQYGIGWNDLDDLMAYTKDHLVPEPEPVPEPTPEPELWPANHYLSLTKYVNHEEGPDFYEYPTEPWPANVTTNPEYDETGIGVYLAARDGATLNIADWNFYLNGEAVEKIDYGNNVLGLPEITASNEVQKLQIYYQNNLLQVLTYLQA